MADYFGQDEEETQEETQEEGTFTIGDATYTQDELQELVEKGKFAQEVEKTQNTKLDKVFPEYTRKSQELKEAKQEAEELRKQIEQQQQQRQTGDITPEQAEAAREAARNLGLLTKDDFSKLMAENFRDFYASEKSIDARISEGRKLESEIDGSDGRPKFNMEDMATWMQDQGYGNLTFEKAYKLRYDEQLDRWKEDQFTKAKRGGMDTITGSQAGSKQPAKIKVTRDNLEELINEHLSS